METMQADAVIPLVSLVVSLLVGRLVVLLVKSLVGPLEDLEMVWAHVVFLLVLILVSLLVFPLVDLLMSLLVDLLAVGLFQLRRTNRLY